MKPSWVDAAIAAALGASTAAVGPIDLPSPPKAQAIASGVWLIPGAFPPKREPDGNTVVFAAPKGLILLDTGRHPWHRKAIEDFAQSRRAPVAAIFNSHWHLDHTSGNAELKRAYPSVRIYASHAIEDALAGFLPQSAAEGRQYLASGKADPVTAEDVRGDIATIESRAGLVPDEFIEASKVMVVAGKRLSVNLARNAATAGDVWLFDPATRTAAVGDLVTLPAPFLDTACPSGWRKALADVWATPFRTAIPGHGLPMSRTQFAAYRNAFENLMDCSASARDKHQCAADWVEGVRPLLAASDSSSTQAQPMTESYIDLLRHNGGKSAYCQAT